jgi:hypothetical protein
MRRAGTVGLGVLWWIFGLLAVLTGAVVVALILPIFGVTFWVGFPICVVIGLVLLITFKVRASRTG